MLSDYSRQYNVPQLQREGIPVRRRADEEVGLRFNGLVLDRSPNMNAMMDLIRKANTTPVKLDQNIPKPKNPLVENEKKVYVARLKDTLCGDSRCGARQPLRKSEASSPPCTSLRWSRRCLFSASVRRRHQDTYKDDPWFISRPS